MLTRTAGAQKSFIFHQCIALGFRFVYCNWDHIVERDVHCSG